MRKRQVGAGGRSLAPAHEQARERPRLEGEAAPSAPSGPVSRLEVTTALGSSLAGEETRDAALLAVMRELNTARAAVFVRGEDGSLELRASRGLPPGAPSTLAGAPPSSGAVLGPGDEAHDRHGLVLLVPIGRHDRPFAVLGLGDREGLRRYGAEERAFLGSVAAFAAAAFENRLLRDELRRAHQTLARRAFELHNLFDLSRDLTESSAEEAIRSLILTTAMGHFVVSRCALYLDGPHGLVLAAGRGLRREAGGTAVPTEEVQAALESVAGPKAVADLPEGPLRRLLSEARMALVVPLAAASRVEGVLAVGPRASGMPFSEEDRDVAQALARQAMAALDNARLRRVREEKERQDRELQIAREIQRSLFPPRRPELRGFEVAAESRPCYEVGGDSYDWIPLGEERLALVTADVAGKGTPASLLMASVHAFVHAQAGTAGPATVLESLNRFLLARTQASRFVTLFYGELDAGRRRLVYVNAGHVPPYRVSRDGTVSRLHEGGPALGLLAETTYEVGEVGLDPGDVVALVTDGVTEALSPDGLEFGDDRVCAAIRGLSGGSACAILDGLVTTVGEWAVAPSFADDLTVLVLKAQ